MQFLRLITISFMLTLAFSCAHNHGAACCQADGPKMCKDGLCMKDASCCKNKCKNCTGDKKACQSGQCHLKKKS